MDGWQRDREEFLDDPLDPLLAGESPHPTSHSESVAHWRPEPGAGQVVGGILLLLFAVLLFASVRQFGSSGVFVRALWLLLGSIALFGTVAVSILIARLRSIRYTIEPAKVVVTAVGRRLEVPFRDIADVVFRPRDRVEIEGFERFWPGFYDTLNMTTEGYWRTLATTSPSDRVRLRLRSGLTVAISPERPILFVEALGIRRHAGQVEASDVWEPSHSRAPTSLPSTDDFVREPQTDECERVARLPLLDHLRSWRPAAMAEFRARIVQGDRVSSNFLALSLLTLIALVFIAAWKGDAVNQPLAVHWNAEGEPSWYVRPDGIWIIEGIWIFPLTAAAVVAINAALATLAAAFNRIAEARLLLSASFIVGLLFLVAMMQATGAA